MKAERIEGGKVLLTMSEDEARDLNELTGKIFRDEQGLHVIERDEEKRAQLNKSAYYVSGALFELF